MTSPELPVSMWCWPGRRAASGVQAGPPGEFVLAMFLDPVNLVLTVPPFPNGHIVMAQFLRQLARAAFQMASEIDPLGPSGGRPTGAHRASESTGGYAGPSSRSSNEV